MPELIVAINNLNQNLKTMMGLVDFVLLAVIVDFVLDLVLVVWLFARVLDLPLAVK